MPICTYEEFVEGLRFYLKQVSTDINKEILKFQKTCEKVPENIRIMHDRLAKMGWYMPPNILLRLSPKQLEKAASETGESINELMISLAKEIEYDVLESVRTKFPERYEIIEKALEAHRKEEYILSIPVFLMEADGICKETVGEYLFLKRTNRQKLVEKLRKNKKISDSCYLNPLLTICSISANENKRNEEMNGFNRHKIMHGSDNKYGTEENSYRSIVLLNYLVQLQSYKG